MVKKFDSVAIPSEKFNTEKQQNEEISQIGYKINIRVLKFIAGYCDSGDTPNSTTR